MMLENVKVGDKLWVSSSNGVGGIAIVKRITPKEFVVVTYGNSEVTFRRDGNERTSDTWHWRIARLITDDEIVTMRLEALRRRTWGAFAVSIDNLTAEQCQRIMDIIKDGE